MLAEAIERERDREDEEDRDDIELECNPPSGDEHDRDENRQLKDDRGETFAGDARAQFRFVSGRFFCRGTKVNRKKRRSEVEELQPAHVDFRREVMPLRIFFI